MTCMLVENPYSIPYDTSLLNEDGTYRVFDFVADEKTTCFFIRSNNTKEPVDNYNAHLFIYSITMRIIASNPRSFTYDWFKVSLFSIAISAVIVPSCFCLCKWYYSK
jgi:hypothetical protein